MRIFLLWMRELVHQRHLLHQVSSDGANQLVEVVLREALSPGLGLPALRQPEGDVVVEGGVFTEGLRIKHTHRTIISIKTTCFPCLSAKNMNLEIKRSLQTPLIIISP